MKNFKAILIALFAMGTWAQLAAQCAEIVSSPASASCNSSYNFNVTGNSFGTTFDFNSGQLPQGWNATAFTVGAPCTTPMVDGSFYYWASAISGIRYVETNALDVSSGGNIDFYMRYGADDPNVGCEDPDLPSEGVFLQFSTNNGFSWTTIDTWAPVFNYQGPLYSWNTYSYPIPPAAQTMATQFRWYQPQNSGAGFDNWGLDNIEVAAVLAGSNFLWDFGDGNTSTAQNPSHTYANPGTYTVTLTVSGPNCNIVDTEVVTVSAGPSLSTTINDASNCSASDGSIQVTVINGTPPYTYTWQPAQGNTANPTNLAPGFYDVMVQDANGCILNATYEVDCGCSLTLATTHTNTLCDLPNGSIDATPSSGTAPYTYTLNGQATTLPATGLSAGMYTLEAEDANGCLASENITIDPSTGLSVSTSITHTTCGLDNGAVAVTLVQGTLPLDFYDNLGNPISLTGLAAGSYQIDVVDADGCTQTLQVSIQPSTPLDFTLSETHTTCGQSDGSLTANVVTGSSPVEYSLNGGAYQSSPTFMNLSAGTYSVMGMDSDGCTLTLIAIINGSDDLDFTLSQIATTCGADNGSITVDLLSANGGEQYRIDGGAYQQSNVFNNVSAGTHTIDGMDASGCMHSESISVGGSIELTLAYSLQSTSCGQDNGRIEVLSAMGNPPIEYKLDNNPWGSNTVWEDLTAGVHVLQARDAQMCSFVRSIVINGSIDLDFELTSMETTCGLNNGRIDIQILSVNGTAQFSLDGGPYQATMQFDGLAPGLHSITGVDDEGCTKSYEIEVIGSEAARADIQVTHTTCGDYNGSFYIDTYSGVAPFDIVMNGLNYGDQQLFDELGAGTYTVEITDALGCYDSYTFYVYGSGPPNFDAFIDDSYCDEGNGGIRFKGRVGDRPWMFRIAEDQAFTDQMEWDSLAPGMYTVAMMDGEGCVRTREIEIKDFYSPKLSVEILHPDCMEDNGDLKVDVDATTNYTLYMNHEIIKPDSIRDLEAGSYLLEVLDENGCATSHTYDLSVNAEITTVDVDCDGTLGSISVVPRVDDGYTFELDNGMSNTEGKFDDLAAGTYQMTMSNADGCMRSEEIVIADKTFTALDIMVENASCIKRGKITIEPVDGNGPYMFVMDDQVTSDGEYASYAGTYGVKVIDANGCVVESEVVVDEDPVIELYYEVIRKPSPSGDDGVIRARVRGGMPNFIFWLDGKYVSGAIFKHVSAGEHTLRVMDGAGCTTEITFEIPANRATAQHQLSRRSVSTALVYPNPMSDILYIDDLAATVDQKVVLRDLLGHTIKRIDCSEQSQLSIDTHDLKAGIYILEIYNQNEVTSHKVMKAE